MDRWYSFCAGLAQFVSVDSTIVLTARDRRDFQHQRLVDEQLYWLGMYYLLSSTVVVY